MTMGSYLFFGGHMIEASYIKDGERRCPFCHGKKVRVIFQGYRYCDECWKLLEDMEFNHQEGVWKAVVLPPVPVCVAE
ncbi:MAG: hypothetical protein WCW47_02960 [Candidatus Paceibacterota bacterium]|jgi:hypothetical protein